MTTRQPRSAQPASASSPPTERQLAELRAAALEALSRAYAPYSGFPVGAALLAADGTIVPGVNVENAAYGGVICAERGAVAAAVARGLRDFTAVAVATEADEPTPPCGVCRQVLVEFAPSLLVLSVTRDGREARWSLGELLPHAFTPASLRHG